MGWLRPQHRDRPVAYLVAECVKHFESIVVALESLNGFRYRIIIPLPVVKFMTNSEVIAAVR
jgi:hypothetical protein